MNIITFIRDAGYVADNPTYAKAPKLYVVYFYGTSGNGTNIYCKYTYLKKDFFQHNFFTLYPKSFFSTAHPLDFIAYIDVAAKTTLGIEDLPIQQNFDTTNRQGNSVPTAEYPYFPNQLPPNSITPGLHPLKISQPNGPSFKISGREVTWQNFQFRVGYNPREGGYIYTVTFNDKGVIRPIVYRMSISDMYLQYGDPRPPYHRKSVRLYFKTHILLITKFIKTELYFVIN